MCVCDNIEHALDKQAAGFNLKIQPDLTLVEHAWCLDTDGPTGFLTTPSGESLSMLVRSTELMLATGSG